MKKAIILFVLVLMVSLLVAAPNSVKAEGITDIESGFNILGVIYQIVSGQSGEKPAPPPTVQFGAQVVAKVEQPEVSMPDKDGWREIKFPYNTKVQVAAGHIAKIHNGKHTVHLANNGDDVELKKGEPIWIKYTSAIQELLEQAGEPLIVSTVSKKDLKKDIQMITISKDVVKVEDVPTIYDFKKGGNAYKGKLIKVFVTDGTLDYWDQKNQASKKAIKGETVETSEFIWKKNLVDNEKDTRADRCYIKQLTNNQKKEK